jgi:predicted ATP-binding protein involved in virulence
MHLLDLTLSNFRRFEHFHCELHPRFTLFVGENGAGKTSVLKALERGTFATLKGVINIAVQQLKPQDAHLQHNVDVADENWGQRQYPIEIRSQAILDIDQPARLGATFQVTQKFNFLNDSWNVIDSYIKRSFEEKNTLPIPCHFLYWANKPSGNSTSAQIVRPFTEKKQIFQHDGNVSVQTLAQWFQYYELRRLQENKTPLVFAKVKEAVLNAIHAEDIGYIARDNNLQVKHAGLGWRPFDELSDGQQRIAAIFCDLALRCASLNSHLGDDCIRLSTGVVCIDELDLHLHPKWQRDVVPDLLRTFPGLQFIATSHSPFLLQAAFEHGAVVELPSGQTLHAQDTSIEDIAEHQQGIVMPSRGKRFEDMKNAAQRYYELLERVPQASEEEIDQLKKELDALLIPYANDPAYAALLEMHRLAAGI